MLQTLTAFNIDLLIELLSWLPAKSVIRFKSICKQWRSLITSPHFVKLHVTRSKTRPGGTNLVFFFIGEYLCITSYIFRDQLPIYVPLLSRQHIGYNAVSNVLDGLICLFQRNCSYRFPVIYNITTREHVFLPLGGVESTHTWRHISTGFWCYLGFDHVRSEYKLLMRSCNSVFDIATLGSTSSNSCKRVLDIPTSVLNGQNHFIQRPSKKNRETDLYIHAPSFYLNGVVYWLEIIKDEKGIKRPAIASFDFVIEKVKVVEILYGFSIDHLKKGYYITEVDGMLMFVTLKGVDKISRRRILSSDSDPCPSLRMTDEIYSSSLDNVYQLNDGLFAKKVKVKDDANVSYICYDVEDWEKTTIEIPRSRQTESKTTTLIQVSHVSESIMPLRGPHSCYFFGV